MQIDLAKAKELFLAVLELPASERAAYLDTACAGDTALKERIEAMLRTHENSGELLPRAPGEMLADSGATEAEATAAFAQQAEWSVTQAEHAGLGPHDLAFLSPSANPGKLGRLGHYEIEAVIGRGGFGIVLKAFDERLHRVVAIKVLSLAYAANGAARNRFIREARAVAAVKNEHVVGIYDVQDDAQPPYFVMELIDGVSLQDKIDKQGALGVKEILRIGMQIAEGLAAAHKQGKIHRDIKPANILLENGVERVKITDFGLARAVDDASVTQSGTVAGTPMYMSPEQAEGLPIDHRSDLFSLGTVLYAMCTGHPPFRASGTHAVLKRVIEAAPRPIREINSEIPDWLADIIARLHAKKPEDRFQSAKEVAELLGARLADVQAGRAIQGEPSRVSDRVGAPGTGPSRRVARPRAFAGIAAVFAVGCLLLGGIAYLFWPSPQGIVRFEANRDDSIKVFIDHKEVVLGLVTNDKLEAQAVVRPGEHTLLVRRGELEFTNDNFLVKPGEFVKVRIAWDKNAKALTVDDKVISARDAPPDEPGWVQLFNGKDLDGWEKPYSGEWRVVDGVLEGRPGKALVWAQGAGIRSFLRSKRADFENFHLRTEVKLPPFFLSGIAYRCASSAPLESGYFDPELMINGGDAWTMVEIIANGRRLITKVNGKIMRDVELRDLDHQARVRGHIGLVACGIQQGTDPDRTGVAFFKKIEIKELPPERPGWVQLFNGKDLTGWHADRRHAGNWHVASGNLVCSKAENAWLFSDRADYKDYVLRLEYQLERGNAAAILRAQEAGDINLLLPDQAPPGLAFGLPGIAKKPGPDDWQVLEITVRGKRRILRINGRAPKEEELPDSAPPAGYIALQAFADPLVRFRKIEVKELSPDEPAWVELFNGKDLKGWTETLGTGNWRVENGVLVGSMVAKPGNWHARLRLAGKEYANFHLRADVRGSGLGSGYIYFRTGGEKSYILALGDKLRGSLELMAGGPKWLSLVKGDGEEGAWHQFELIADGPKLVSKVDGKVVAAVNNPTLTRGNLELGLSATPGPTRVEFKKIAIKELSPPEPERPSPEAGWVQLFNGRDLHGWVANIDKGQPADRAFEVFGGVLIARGLPLGYMRTEKAYENFILELECQSSVAFSETKPATAGGLLFQIPQPDPGYAKLIGQSLEIVPAEYRGVNFYSWNPPGGIAKPTFNVKGFDWRKFKPGWNKLRIESRPGVLRLFLNGEDFATVSDYPQRKGYIGIQSLGTGLRYRNIRIKELPAEEPAWTPLFNGKDLSGWETFDHGTGRWKVVDGSITCDGPRSYLFSKRDDFKDFHFRIEARANAKGNSGQYFRCSFDPDRPKGYYAQINNSDPGAGTRTGALNRLRLSGQFDVLANVSDGLVLDNAWFTQEVIARGNHLQVLVNGKKVADYTEKDSMFMQGRLALEHYTPPTRIEFRKIEIKELPPAEPSSSAGTR